MTSCRAATPQGSRRWCCLVEVRAPFNPTSAVETMAATLKEYGLFSTVGDRYAAGWIPDAFSKVGVKYEYSERDRSQCYLDVLPLFMAGRVKLIDNAKMVAQFVSLERRSTLVGRDKVDHGPSGHDDLCNAASLALSAPASGYLHDMEWVGVPESYAAQPYFSRIGGLPWLR
jgi:hypothetical protein